ncbi:MAG TPA: OmpA family protein [Rhodocyclaceae bacterium]|nr:OmpA family protein [Rhodocyclaceae bacterium]
MNRSRNLFARAVPAAVLSCVLACAFTGSAIADQSEQSKLKALQRALAAPQEQPEEFSAKSIVFDKDSESPAATVQAPQRAAAGDCALLSSDVATTSVDFQIQFKLGSAELSPVSENTLQQIAKILALTPERCVFVEGHTDATGRPDANMRLSRDRAETVVRFITDRAGVLRSRLITVGKGSTETLKNLSPTDPKNRRVVFKVVS